MEILILASTLLLSTAYGIFITWKWAKMECSLQRAIRTTRTIGLQNTALLKAAARPEGKVLGWVTAAERGIKGEKMGEKRKGYVTRQIKRQFPGLSDEHRDRLIESSVKVINSYGE